MKEVSKREKEAGIVPDIDIDTFMKETSIEGQKRTLQTDYILKMSLVIDSPVHSSNSEDFAAFLDAELNSSFDISPDLDGEDEDEDKDDDEDDSKPNIESYQLFLTLGLKLYQIKLFYFITLLGQILCGSSHGLGL
ncbi:unnamed protein product [Camellia sinensis]